MKTPANIRESVFPGEEPMRMSFANGEFQIVGDDDRTLYDIRVFKDGSIEIAASSHTKHNNIMLDTNLTIIPKGSNRIVISRPEYK
jgi:hypothetical protein